MVTDDLDVPRLIVMHPPELQGLVLPLSRPELVIGHSDTADLVLEDQFVSRRHALVTVDPAGQVTIRDLNSTSGTFVNDERLEGPRVLRAGDTVRFADLVTRFEPGETPETAATAATDDTTQAMPVLASAAPDTAPLPVRASRLQRTVRPPTRVRRARVGPAAAGPEANGAGNTYTVTGTVISPALPGVGGLTVQLVDKNVGGDQVLASTQTNSDGSYAFEPWSSPARYLARHHKTQPDLQVQVLAGGSVLAASEVSYSAPTTVSLDVVLPAGAAGPAERVRDADRQPGGGLSGPPGRAAGGRRPAGHHLPGQQDRLGRPRRGAGRRSPTSSARSPRPRPHGRRRSRADTWPVPVPTVSLRPEFYYALFRAGLPASPTACSRPARRRSRRSGSRRSPGRHPAGAGQGGAGRHRELPGLSAARQSLDRHPAGRACRRCTEMLPPTLPGAAQQTAVRPALRAVPGRLGQLLARGRAGVRDRATAAKLQLTGQAVLPHRSTTSRWSRR